MSLYRAGVGIVLFDAAGLVFAGERLDTPGAWQFPQGGIDPGETPLEAAARELREEVGTAQVEWLAETETLLRYDFPAEFTRLRSRGFHGQEQVWFAARLDETATIDLAAHGEPEFGRWRWAKITEIVDQIVPFKRATYEAVAAAFARFAA